MVDKKNNVVNAEYIGTKRVNMCLGPYDTNDWQNIYYQMPCSYGYDQMLDFFEKLLSSKEFILDIVQKAEFANGELLVVDDIKEKLLYKSKMLQRECGEIVISGISKDLKYSFVQISLINQTNALILRVKEKEFSEKNLHLFQDYANKLAEILWNIMYKYEDLSSSGKSSTKCFDNPNNNELYQEGMKKFCIVQYKEAIEYFDKAIKKTPSHENAYFYRGLAHDVLGNIEYAIKDYETVINLNPNNIDALANLGIIMFKLNSYENAIDYLMRAIVLAKKDNYKKSIQNYENIINEIKLKMSHDRILDI